MELDAPPQLRPFVWPPERGWSLFIAWMGGILVTQILQTIVTSAVLMQGGVQAWDTLTVRVALTLPPLALATWQAWLLFRGDRIRFVLWSVLPLLGIFLPRTIAVIGYMSLAAPLIEAAILRGVRQRAWAWILAGMAGVVLTQAGIWFVYGMGSGDSIANWAMNLIGNTSPNLRMQLNASLGRGCWIAGEILSAVVLAWKMPPVRSSAVSPPPLPAD
jgi:hypothetical protein